MATVSIINNFGDRVSVGSEFVAEVFADDFYNSGESRRQGVYYDDVDPDELDMGIQVEMEHTDDEDVATKIVLDHLAEFPGYYTALREMEEGLRK